MVDMRGAGDAPAAGELVPDPGVAKPGPRSALAEAECGMPGALSRGAGRAAAGELSLAPSGLRAGGRVRSG